MSVTTRSRRRARGSLPSAFLLSAMLGGVVLLLVLQVAYPLVHGQQRRAVTIASVVVFAAGSLAHAAWSRGRGAAWWLLIVAGGGGLVAEVIGSHTGFPFGHYEYANSLGAEVFGVPVVVPFAWLMMAWPALIAGRRVAHGRRVVTVMIGASILTTWDLFLDPQMVHEGHWRWLATSGPALNGIPIVNTAGWFAVAVLMMGLLDRVVARDVHRSASDLFVAVVLGWTWFSQTFGHLVFFGTPWVGLTGGLAMGAVLLVGARAGE